MPYRLIFLAALLGLMSACASVESLMPYESEDLMVVKHNDNNNYLLLVYRDPLGQTRHVLRRDGVTEIVLTYTIEGNIELKTRGKKARKINPIEAGHITQRINSLLKAGEKEPGAIASI